MDTAVAVLIAGDVRVHREALAHHAALERCEMSRSRVGPLYHDGGRLAGDTEIRAGRAAGRRRLTTPSNRL